MGDKTTEKMIEIADNVMETCHEYYCEHAKKNGKKGVVWLRNDETGQLMVYTRGEYTKEILDFSSTLR